MRRVLSELKSSSRRGQVGWRVPSEELFDLSLSKGERKLASGLGMKRKCLSIVNFGRSSKHVMVYDIKYAWMKAGININNEWLVIKSINKIAIFSKRKNFLF